MIDGNGTERRCAIDFLLCALLCRLWLEQKERDPETRKEEHACVETIDAYEPFVRLFGEKRWNACVNTVFRARWEPFEICDASEERHLFVSRITGGWPPLLEPGDAGSLFVDPVLVQWMDRIETDEQCIQALSYQWRRDVLQTAFVLETMRRSRPQARERASVPVPTPPVSLRACWEAAQRRVGRSVVASLKARVKRCRVCGSRTFTPDDTTNDPNRVRCAHCDAPHAIK